MKLNTKVNEALLETAGARSHVASLLDHGINKLEQDLLTTPPDAALLLAARQKLEGAKALRQHVLSLMKPADK